MAIASSDATRFRRAVLDSALRPDMAGDEASPQVGQIVQGISEEVEVRAKEVGICAFSLLVLYRSWPLDCHGQALLHA